MNRTYENPFLLWEDDHHKLRKMRAILVQCLEYVGNGRKICTSMESAAYFLSGSDEWAPWAEAQSDLRSHVMFELRSDRIAEFNYFGEWLAATVESNSIRLTSPGFELAFPTPNWIMVAGRSAWVARMLADLDEVLPPALRITPEGTEFPDGSKISAEGTVTGPLAVAMAANLARGNPCAELAAPPALVVVPTGAQYQCPQCGSVMLNIKVVKTAVVVFKAEGDHELVDIQGDTEWDGDSVTDCYNCTFHGRLKDFKPPKPERPLTGCAAGRDGECRHSQCPQLRDNEPAATGRHCPPDTRSDEL